jgi:spore coat protein U-like protein
MKKAVLLIFMVVFSGGYLAAQGTLALSISTLNFGDYTGATLDGTASGNVTCSVRNTCNGEGWNIPMNAGTGSGATETLRKMTSSTGSTLNYELYTDAGYSKYWGNTTGNELTGTGVESITVYGQIVASQVVPPGTYSDTVSTDTTSFTVTATIVANCTVSASAMYFGYYTGTTNNSTSTLTVNCTNLAPYTVGLNAGTGKNATVTNRLMTGTGTATLGYGLYQNSGHSINWGMTSGTDTVGGTGTGAAQSITVYGKIASGTIPAAGTYTDTITVSMNF